VCSTNSDGTGPLHCQPGVTCVTGRPFLVRGVERLAEAVARDDWRSLETRPTVSGLSAAVRDQLAAHWAAIGRMEHASIAAFARFTMHLLALGAPPELVRASQEAMNDELGHTLLAFGLASAYGGRPLGPGALPIEGALEHFEAPQVVATLIREGCVGETVAAIEASTALQEATDPAVRSVLRRIAREELRHAELAWRTLAWLVGTGRISRDAVERELARARAEADGRVPLPSDARDLREHGVVSEARRDAIRRATFESIVGPCSRRVLGSGPRSAGEAPRSIVEC
jgi:hypothetical protein